MKTHVALAQMHIEPGELDKNIQKGFEFIEQAANQSCSIIVLPELWASGYDLTNAAGQASRSPEILNELLIISKKHNLSIAGSLLEQTSHGIYNTLSWISPAHSCPIEYRKIHLFRLMDEDRWLKPGDTLQMAPSEIGLLGLTICFDLRFPELFRSYALKGSHAFILSAEWPSKRIAHWQTLLRARAIENLSFIFAANCVGPTHKDSFGGCSAIISPWGETLVEGSPVNEDLLIAEIDTEQIERARKFLPVFADRRPDIY